MTENPRKSWVEIGHRGIWPAGRDIWVEKPGPPIVRLGTVIWAVLTFAVLAVIAVVVVLLLAR